MNRPRATVARAVAAAFLAGAWTARAMTDRALQAVPALVGVPRPWQIAATVLRWHPRPPTDATRALVTLIARTAALRTAIRTVLLTRVTRHRHVYRHFLACPRMSPTPWPVPALPTVGDLADWLHLDIPTLDWLADRRALERHATSTRLRNYRYDWVTKRSGGARLLEAPKDRLKAAQRQVLHGILDAIPPHDAVHGFRPGRSTLTCAAPHVGQAVVVSVDLEAFFSAVPVRSLYGVFRAAVYPWGVTHSLVALCTNRVPAAVLAAQPPSGDSMVDRRALRRLADRHLPSGAPTSPALANLATRRLDLRLHAAAASVDARYTRYADDLTFSGGESFRRGAGTFVDLVRTIVREEGHRVHAKKTHVMGRGTRQEVVGVVVNEHLAVARDEYDALRALLHNCAVHGPASQDREGHRDFRAHLQGRVAAMSAVDPRRGAKLWELFGRVGW